MWMEQIEMEPNGREELLTQTASTSTRLATFNGSVVYGTHESEMVRHWKGNRKMV